MEPTSSSALTPNPLAPPVVSDPLRSHSAPTLQEDGDVNGAAVAVSTEPQHPPPDLEQGHAANTATQDEKLYKTKSADPSLIKVASPRKRRTIANALAQHPDRSVKHVVNKVFPRANPLKRLLHRFHVKHSVINGLTDAELAHWEAQGPELRRLAGWKLPGEEGPGAEVSPLFWKMYLSLMPTLDRDPLSGMVAPDLLGSTTTMPLSIISLIPDIMKHYAEVIVRAEKEIFLATNYWQ